jgi:hypothetical protein
MLDAVQESVLLLCVRIHSYGHYSMSQLLLLLCSTTSSQQGEGEQSHNSQQQGQQKGELYHIPFPIPNNHTFMAVHATFAPQVLPCILVRLAEQIAIGYAAVCFSAATALAVASSNGSGVLVGCGAISC